MIKRILATGAVVAITLGGFGAVVASAKPDDDKKVTICHAAGKDGTTHFNTITIGWNAVYGPAGHFYENGTPRAGHEQDSLGECKVDEPTDPTSEPTEPTETVGTEPTDEPSETVTEPTDSTETVPTEETTATAAVVTPEWWFNISCLTPVEDWVVVGDSNAYTGEVITSNSYYYRIEFAANEGFEFTESDEYTLSDDRGRALVTGNFPVIRCVPPTPTDKPETETKCSVNKCVKIRRDDAGKVIERDVITYGNVKEEGM